MVAKIYVLKVANKGNTIAVISIIYTYNTCVYVSYFSYFLDIQTILLSKAKIFSENIPRLGDHYLVFSDEMKSKTPISVDIRIYWAKTPKRFIYCS